MQLMYVYNAQFMLWLCLFGVINKIVKITEQIEPHCKYTKLFRKPIPDFLEIYLMRKKALQSSYQWENTQSDFFFF